MHYPCATHAPLDATRAVPHCYLSHTLCVRFAQSVPEQSSRAEQWVGPAPCAPVSSPFPLRYAYRCFRVSCCAVLPLLVLSSRPRVAMAIDGVWANGATKFSTAALVILTLIGFALCFAIKGWTGQTRSTQDPTR